MSAPTDLYQRYVSYHHSRIYRTDAKEYEMYRQYFRKNYGPFLPQDREVPVVDIGCGLGHCLYFFAKEGYCNRTGVDLCPEALEHCVKHGLLQMERAVQEDAQTYLASHVGCFGVIVMNDLVEHLPKETIVPVLRAAREALRPGGVLLIKTVNAANPITGCSSRYVDFTHTVAFTEESLRFVCISAGFRDVSIYPQDIWIFNPLVNAAGRVLHWLLSTVFRVLFLAYGRQTTRIFSKDLIAVVRKEAHESA